MQMQNYFSDIEIEKSVSKVKELLPDKDVYNGQLFQKFVKTKVTQDFTRKSLKRINVKKTKFEKCLFVAAAGTGSKFTESVFSGCDFTGSNFQDCYFNKCSFKSHTIIRGANFSHSIFIDCTFEKSIINQSTLYDCRFENCTFVACEISSDTTENSVLYNCTIRQVDLAHINLEYMQIKKIHMENVKLPPYQIAYIIGAPYYIRNTSDKVMIHTDKGDMDTHKYKSLYKDLSVYYYSQHEFFPLSNILIALEKYDDAFEYIKMGIEEACDYFDFRMIKHYCRLVCSDDIYSSKKLKEIYDMIMNLSYNNNWDLNILHSYMLNIGEIRELLLNNSSGYKQRVEILIKTNIEKDDLTSINELYNEINILIRENCSLTHVDSIELRHNSPYELYITCIDMLPEIMALLSSIYGVLAIGNKFLDVFKNFEEVRRICQENSLHKYQKEEKELDIELKRLELIAKKEEMNNKKTSSIYTVTEIEHNIKCNTFDMAQKLAPEYLHYKYTKEKLEQ